MPILSRGDIIICLQDPENNVPAIGGYRRWVSPEDRELFKHSTFGKGIDVEGYVTYGPFCYEHRRQFIAEAISKGALPEHIIEISLDEFMAIEGARGNRPETE